MTAHVIRLRFGSLQRPVRSLESGVLVFILAGLWVWLVSAAGLQAGEEPPAPNPSAGVQLILAEIEQKLKAQQWEAAREAAQRAETLARETQDPPGEARGHRGRALALQELGRSEEAVAAWRAAAAAWARLGDGPGQVEALAAAGLLLWASQPAEANALFVQALTQGRAE